MWDDCIEASTVRLMAHNQEEEAWESNSGGCQRMTCFRDWWICYLLAALQERHVSSYVITKWVSGCLLGFTTCVMVAFFFTDQIALIDLSKNLPFFLTTQKFRTIRSKCTAFFFSGWPLSRHYEIPWQFAALLTILTGTHTMPVLLVLKSTIKLSSSYSMTMIS